MDLLIRAVQEAVGESFEATVLKPNEGLPLVRESVAMVSNWSGGQKLTTALLLYCTLARLRATNRKGRGGSRMSVLILDNPLGTANHIDLVDLQLTVAHLTGLQLIIATGVNDEDAIAAYPNIIRLRNLKDQNGHRSYVRVQRGTDGVVEAVRVYRKNGTTLREVHAN